MSVAPISLSRKLALKHRLLLHQLLAITIITMTTASLTDMATVTVDIQCPEHTPRLKIARCRTTPVPDQPDVTANHPTLCCP